VSTVGIVVGSDAVIRVVGVVSRGIDADLNPSEQPVVEIIAKVDILREGAISTVSLLNGPYILSISSDSLCVGGVRIGLLHG
jgi:hypothetical protein